MTASVLWTVEHMHSSISEALQSSRSSLPSWAIEIVAIPMISEGAAEAGSSRKQKDFEMNADTSGLTVAGHVGNMAHH